MFTIGFVIFMYGTLIAFGVSGFVLIKVEEDKVLTALKTKVKR